MKINPAVLSSSDSIFITFVASLLIWVLFIGLAILWVIDGKARKEQAFHAFLSCTFAWVVTEMIKYFFPTLRPFQISGALPLTLTIPFDASFPSSHSAVAFSLALSIFLHDKKTGVIFLVGAFLVAWGRVYSNVHTFYDVLVGGLVGIATSYLVGKLHVFKLLNSTKKA